MSDDDKSPKQIDENDPAIGSADKRDDGLTGDPRESTAMAEEARIRRERAEEDAKAAKKADEPKAPAPKRGGGAG